MQRLDDVTRTLYAELLDLCRQAEAERLASGLPTGSFVSKKIRGKTYWYLQRHDGSARRQHYLGLETPDLRAWMDRATQMRDGQKADAESRRRLCKMLETGGALTESAALTKVLTLLGEAGVFRLGGVLIGTHAMAVYGNVLGVRFDGATIRTQDLDVAHDPVLAVGVDGERADAASALERSGLEFLPVPKLDPRLPSTSFHVRGRQLRVDFLTPMRGRHDGNPVFLPTLGVAAQPLRFLDYLLAESMQAVVVGGSGVLVRVPDPARFAFHKLWTAGERPRVEHGRSAKDRRQADQVLEILLAERPGDVEAAWAALAAHPTARTKIRKSFEHLDETTHRGLLDLLAT